MNRHSDLPTIVKVAAERSAVTGACMAMRREVFEAAGPLDAQYYPGPFNDVEYCWRIRERLGLRIVYTPHSELFHHESATRTETTAALGAANAAIRGTYWHALNHDPTFSANLKQPNADRPAPIPRTNLNTTTAGYRVPGRPPLAILHIPKTAGSAFRVALEERLPAAVLVVDGKETVECYGNEPVTIDRVRARAVRCPVWISHMRSGFDSLLGIQATYATFLREPVARLRSHWHHLRRDAQTPLRGDLREAPLEDLLRRGVIPGNLMVRMLTGGKIEDVSWSAIYARGQATAARFVGFGLPAAVWRGEVASLDRLAEVPPDEDFRLLDEAWKVITERYAFVGLQERMPEHAARFAKALAWDSFFVGAHNVTPARKNGDEQNSELISAYTRLDRMLYERIASLGGGLLIDDHRLAQSAAYGL